MRPLVILGAGYVGARIARHALLAGRFVRVCARTTSRLAPLGELGAEVKYADVAMSKQLGGALTGVTGGTVLYSVPATVPLPPGVALKGAMSAAYAAGAECFILLSSSGVYGDRPDDDIWVDEETPLADDAAMKGVISDEETLHRSAPARLRTVALRLAPVYGPGRGVRARLRKGTYKLLDDGQHAISRIHVDDLARAVFAAEEHAPRGSTYLVADDEPTTQGVYAAWLCERLGLPLPVSRGLHDAGARATHRNRKIRNTRLKSELQLTLQYPTFREGEAAIEAEESGEKNLEASGALGPTM